MELLGAIPSEDEMCVRIDKARRHHRVLCVDKCKALMRKFRLKEACGVIVAAQPGNRSVVNGQGRVLDNLQRPSCSQYRLLGNGEQLADIANNGCCRETRWVR